MQTEPFGAGAQELCGVVGSKENPPAASVVAEPERDEQLALVTTPPGSSMTQTSTKDENWIVALPVAFGGSVPPSIDRAPS